MKQHFLIFFLLLSSLLGVAAVPRTFSDSTVVSLITCSPGPEVYARFGHTAVRVKDPVGGIDLVFNYGMFDFSTKHFYVKFIKGETDYKLAAYDFRYFLPEYEQRNSTVWEQQLNLLPAERDRLIGLLMTNYRPENRVYRYNFVFDNCSTRPRVKMEEAIDGRVAYLDDSPSRTFRQWVGCYVGTDTWLKLGIDLIFGDEADRVADREESMFLPEVLMEEVMRAEVVSDDGERRRPLVAEASELVVARPEKPAEPCVGGQPVAVMGYVLLLGVVLLFFGRRSSAVSRRSVLNLVFDTVLFAVVGLIGCIVFFLDYISLHPLVGDNANILWLSPLYLFLAVAQWIRPLRRAACAVGIVNVAQWVLIAVLYVTGVHYFNVAFWPVMVLLLVRTLGLIMPEKRTR